LASDIGSDSDNELPDRGGDSDDEDEDEDDHDEDEDEDDEDDDEDDEEEESGSDSDSDSAPEFDAASEGEGQYEETGANAPRITIPDGVVDYDDEKDVKGKGKAVWHDSADERINVDMEQDKRLKKLARGKKGSLVDGAELQKRLKQQYVFPLVYR
jgi:hypothetical protein